MEEAEAVLNLYDSCWFGIQDMKKQQPPPPCSSTSTSSLEFTDQEIEVKEIPKTSEELKLSRIQSTHTRSMSDELSSMNHDFRSLEFVLLQPKLQTILSGKEVTDREQGERQAPVQQPQVSPKKKRTSIGRKKRESKSLSDLEFEELKGFMDLGFVFSEEDKESSLASIIPGLQRLGKNGEGKGEASDESEVQRPYLSEAWKVQEEKRKKENPLMNWKVPVMNNENDMKDSLKWWAQTVASNVR